MKKLLIISLTRKVWNSKCIFSGCHPSIPLQLLIAGHAGSFFSPSLFLTLPITLRMCIFNKMSPVECDRQILCTASLNLVIGECPHAWWFCRLPNKKCWKSERLMGNTLWILCLSSWPGQWTPFSSHQGFLVQLEQDYLSPFVLFHLLLAHTGRLHKLLC